MKIQSLSLLLAFISISCGSDNPLENTTSYTNTAVGYTLTVPGGWEANEDPTNRFQLEITKGDAQINIVVNNNTQNEDLSDISSDLSGFDRGIIGSGISNYARTNASGLLGTLAAVELTWTGISLSGQRLKGQIVISVTSEYIFLLQYIDDAQNFDQRNFDIVKESFQAPS